MHNFKVEKKLHKILKRLQNKDKKKYKTILRKIEEIVNCTNVNHYKNLKKPMNEFKRVHIGNSFVLIFKYENNIDTICFYDFDHHDKIYK